jgi:hypothetical protein
MKYKNKLLTSLMCLGLFATDVQFGQANPINSEKLVLKANKFANDSQLAKNLVGIGSNLYITAFKVKAKDPEAVLRVAGLASNIPGLEFMDVFNSDGGMSQVFDALGAIQGYLQKIDSKVEKIDMVLSDVQETQDKININNAIDNFSNSLKPALDTIRKYQCGTDHTAECNFNDQDNSKTGKFNFDDSLLKQHMDAITEEKGTEGNKQALENAAKELKNINYQEIFEGISQVTSSGGERETDKTVLDRAIDAYKDAYISRFNQLKTGNDATILFQQYNAQIIEMYYKGIEALMQYEIMDMYQITLNSSIAMWNLNNENTSQKNKIKYVYYGKRSNDIPNYLADTHTPEELTEKAEEKIKLSAHTFEKMRINFENFLFNNGKVADSGFSEGNNILPYSPFKECKSSSSNKTTCMYNIYQIEKHEKAQFQQFKILSSIAQNVNNTVHLWSLLVPESDSSRAFWTYDDQNIYFKPCNPGEAGCNNTISDQYLLPQAYYNVTNLWEENAVIALNNFMSADYHRFEKTIDDPSHFCFRGCGPNSGGGKKGTGVFECTKFALNTHSPYDLYNIRTNRVASTVLTFGEYSSRTWQDSYTPKKVEEEDLCNYSRKHFGINIGNNTAFPKVVKFDNLAPREVIALEKDKSWRVKYLDDHTPRDLMGRYLASTGTTYSLTDTPRNMNNLSVVAYDNFTLKPYKYTQPILAHYKEEKKPHDIHTGIVILVQSPIIAAPAYDIDKSDTLPNSGMATFMQTSFPVLMLVDQKEFEQNPAMAIALPKRILWYPNTQSIKSMEVPNDFITVKNIPIKTEDRPTYAFKLNDSGEMSWTVRGMNHWSKNMFTRELEDAPDTSKYNFTITMSGKMEVRNGNQIVGSIPWSNCNDSARGDNNCRGIRITPVVIE